MKILTSILLTSLLLFTLCSCATPAKDVGIVAAERETLCVKKSTMDKIMTELIYQKQQLMECLERERK
jgi:hypothetical protein